MCSWNAKDALAAIEESLNALMHWVGLGLGGKVKNAMQPGWVSAIRGISKSILHFILHSTILYSTLYSTQQFGQDVDVIDNFDIN